MLPRSAARIFTEGDIAPVFINRRRECAVFPLGENRSLLPSRVQQNGTLALCWLSVLIIADPERNREILLLVKRSSNSNIVVLVFSCEAKALSQSLDTAVLNLYRVVWIFNFLNRKALATSAFERLVAFKRPNARRAFRDSRLGPSGGNRSNAGGGQSCSRQEACRSTARTTPGIVQWNAQQWDRKCSFTHSSPINCAVSTAEQTIVDNIIQYRTFLSYFRDW